MAISTFILPTLFRIDNILSVMFCLNCLFSFGIVMVLLPRCTTEYFSFLKDVERLFIKRLANLVFLAFHKLIRLN